MAAGRGLTGWVRGRPVRVGALAVLVAAVAVLVTLAVRRTPPVRVVPFPVSGVPESGRAVRIDGDLYLPARLPAPAVVLAHGFGGSKDSTASDARVLARHGYAVVSYSARGFGRSGGLIHLDSRRYEVADAQRILDALARRGDIVQDAPGDPRVGVAGASYGGALALLLAGVDRRVDAIAPSITWNDLGRSLVPQRADVGAPGVFARMWAGVFVGNAAVPSVAAAGTPSPCGRFAPDVCAAYVPLATTGRPTPALTALLADSNPATVAGRIRAPTLLTQGEADSLFPLSEADANARAIAAAGTPVKVVWFDGGHDAGSSGSGEVRDLTLRWFDRYLKRARSGADTRFQFTVPAATLSAADSNPADTVRVSSTFPGQVRTSRLPLQGPPQVVVAPPGGQPAAVSSLPGLGQALGAVGSALEGFQALPGQSAVFETPVLAATRVVGTPSVRLRLTPVSGSRDATLFAALYDVSRSGETTLPQRLVAPFRVPIAAGGSVVTVRLPTIVREVAAGDRLRLVVSTTDEAYALPVEPAAYGVALADAGLTVPTVVSTRVGGSGSGLAWVLAAVAAALLAAAAMWLLEHQASRRAGPRSDEGLDKVPLVVRNLSKVYGGGVAAVSDLSFRVLPGEVVGLLGPNGAGKTTVLRMLMGLVLPTSGELVVFGEPVTPGAPVLGRVGAFVEGPGFLPHLSGLDNLGLYWQATGRAPEEALLDLVLEIAGLGADVERKVRTYSHGMRQRLAIAQAMLGLPELLVLDEPTNGLDPPQIRQMREVVRRYAETGRTVLVSSHLLAEVEQTCTSVVVLQAGRLVATGRVADLVGAPAAPPVAGRRLEEVFFELVGEE